jgi:putative acetyltransferase
MMIIRTEKASDYKSIYDFVKNAFETAEVKDGHEQDLVNRLRKSNKYIPELALVAEIESKIIGYIMISKTYVIQEGQRFEGLLLAPLAVDINYRNQKVGSQLIQKATEIAKQMEYKAIFLAGNPAYYNRFGFSPTIDYGIKCSMDIPEELYPNIMVLELFPNALKGIQGIVDLSGEETPEISQEENDLSEEENINISESQNDNDIIHTFTHMQ